MKLARLMVLGVVVTAGIWFVGASSASAQWGYGGSYNRGYGNYGGHNAYRGYGQSPTIHLRTNRGYYHDTSHWDYHPGTVVPHGNHYHYIPGHYDYHRQGHWHH